MYIPPTNLFRYSNLYFTLVVFVNIYLHVHNCVCVSPRLTIRYRCNPFRLVILQQLHLHSVLVLVSCDCCFTFPLRYHARAYCCLVAVCAVLATCSSTPAPTLFFRFRTTVHVVVAFCPTDMCTVRSASTKFKAMKLNWLTIRLNHPRKYRLQRTLPFGEQQSKTRTMEL